MRIRSRLRLCRRLLPAALLACARIQAAEPDHPRMGPETVKCMLRVIERESAFTRMKAAMAMGRARVDTPAALQALAGMLQDEYPPARASALYALGRSGDAKAAPLVAGLLGDKDDLVRVEACRALGELGARKLAARLPLADPASMVRLAALQAAAKIGKGRLEKPLLARLRVESRADLRAACLRALRQLAAPPDPRTVGRTLADKDPEVRARALLWLADARPADLAGFKALIQPLRAAVADPAVLARRAAMPALAHVLGARAQPLLVRALGDADHTVRREAALALGEVGDTSCREALGRLQTERVREVRRAASLALARHAERDPTQRAAIVARALAATRTPDELARIEGLWMLGRLKSDKGFPAILDLAMHDFAKGKSRARDTRASALVMWVINRTRYQGGGKLAMLYLECPDQSLRVQGATALAALRYQPAAGLLCSTLTRTRSVMGELLFAYDGPERTAALRALGAIGGARAMQTLTDIAASVKPLETPANLRIVCDFLVKATYKQGASKLERALRSKMLTGSRNGVIIARAVEQLTGRKVAFKAPRSNPYDYSFFITAEEELE